ncbi:MAG: cysteine desulfurase [Oscillospiraceae bacterium]|nr:cysteine desulfurase [Oscillospiraceae bacterium]
MEVYLDNSATTPVCTEAVQAMQQAISVTWGNPSSMHRIGLQAEHLLNQCRATVAAGLSCLPGEIIFTSGGTEANNLAVLGTATARARQGCRIITSSVEHSSTAESCAELASRGYDVVYLGVDHTGRVKEEDLAAAINRDTILVSLMAVNNEVGTVQPIDVIRRMVRRAGAPALIHCDAVQAFGKLPIHPQQLGADLLTVSSHKIHGPKGAGALYVRNGVKISPILFGGSQEQRLRPGTEPIPAIAGFAAAVAAIPDHTQAFNHVTALRDRLVAGLQAMPGVFINSPSDALPYLTNISVPGLPSEVMINFLTERNVHVSSGSACAKGSKSRVLQAMGLPDSYVTSALRISLSRLTTWQEIDAFLYALAEALATLLRR